MTSTLTPPEQGAGRRPAAATRPAPVPRRSAPRTPTRPKSRPTGRQITPARALARTRPLVEQRPQPAGLASGGARPRPLPHRAPIRVAASAPGPHPVRRPLPPQVSWAVPQPAPRDWAWRTWQWRLFLIVASLGTLGAHLFRIDTSTDLFVDESFYTEVSQSIAHGSMPYATGSYFFLHPPGFFYVAAGWMRIFGLHDALFPQVFSLRRLLAVFAALTALMLGLVVAKAAGRTAAAIVVVLYAVNAFTNRDSAIVILEPATLFWTLAGYAVFMHLAPQDTVRRHRQIALAGLLFGIAALTKEFAVFVTLLPLGLAWIMRCWLTRGEAARAMRWTALPWVLWLAAVTATGHLGQFYDQVTAGFHRTTGNTQISGFNAPGRPSFLETIISNLDSLWTAYAVLGLGSIAVVHIAATTRHNQRLRFLSLFGLGAIPLLAYCVTLGTNEEQFFNFLFFPALICLVVALWNRWPQLGRKMRAAVLLLLVAAVISDSAEYAYVHTHTDDGAYLVDQWMTQHVPDGTVVAVTNPVQREIFLRYSMVNDTAGSTLGPRVRYLVVFGKQVDQGYAFVDRATIDRQTRGQRVAFSTTDRSNGQVVVYAIG